MIQTLYVSIVPACNLEMCIICLFNYFLNVGTKQEHCYRSNVRSLCFMDGQSKANGRPMADGWLLFLPLPPYQIKWEIET